jgi:membrane peptidoglycan carboxypeptidase
MLILPRPAARRYFGREPRELTPADMAFLVAIIPGPIKYQSSFAHGTPGPGLRSLIDELLAKLRSVDAIGEEEHRRASARRTHRRGRRLAARMIGGEWKRAGGHRQSPLLVRFRL